MEKLISILIISLICLMLIDIPQTYAGSHRVTFTVSDLSIGDVFRVKLDVVIYVQTDVPVVFSGGSSKMSIKLVPGETFLSITYLGNTYTARFPTAIGSVEIPIIEIPLIGKLYVKIDGNVEAELDVRGPGRVSSNRIYWTSEGSKSIKISHTGSIFSSESFNVIISFLYKLKLGAGIKALISSFEYEADLITLSGTPTITENISTFPIIIFVTIGVIVTGVAVAVVVYRRRVSKKIAGQVPPIT